MRKFEGYQKGVNLGGWLSQADEKTKQHYDTFIGREDIERIASWGCDHVRLPIDYIVIESEDGDMLEDGYAYVVLFNTNGTAGVSSSNKASKGTQLNYSSARYALCRGEQACNPTQPDDPSTITTQQCCEYYKDTNGNSIWSWDTTSSTCGCPSGTTWFVESQECLPDNSCIYRYQWPSEPYTIAHNDNGVSWTETKEVTYQEVVGCSDPNTYCVVKWKDANCTKIDEAIFSGYNLYGECVPYNADVRYYQFHCSEQ